jgi:hypothetical protein
MEPSHDIGGEKHRAGHAREENNVLVPRLSESRVNRFSDFLDGQSDLFVRVKDARDWMLAKLHDDDDGTKVLTRNFEFFCGESETKVSQKVLRTTLFLRFFLS